MFLSQGNYGDPQEEYLVLDRSLINGGLFGRYTTIDENTAKIFAPNVFLHSDEEYFPAKVDVFLANVNRANGYMTTKEGLGCDSCDDPTFLDGEKQDVNSVPVYADIIRRT